MNILVARDDVEVSTKDDVGRTPLSYAAEHGNEAVVKILVVRDDIKVDNKDDRGGSPLSYATEDGNEASHALNTSEAVVTGDWDCMRRLWRRPWCSGGEGGGTRRAGRMGHDRRGAWDATGRARGVRWQAQRWAEVGRGGGGNFLRRSSAT